MASLSRFDSTIARFDPPPMTRSWPGPEGLRALFEACVHELPQHCRRHPLAWLSDADLASLLYAILAHQLPAHGLSPRCLHASLALPANLAPDARYRARHEIARLALQRGMPLLGEIIDPSDHRKGQPTLL